jgi:DNA primase
MSRIKDADVELVKERAAIDEIVRDYVTLRTAGAGALKGLCPFHDERSPSFTVTPTRNLFHCFGCQESGDAISFLQKLEGLSFIEVIEKLAARYNIVLHYEESNSQVEKLASVRARLVAANKAAAAYFVTQLGTPDAEIGRQFLISRGFNSEAAAQFGVGYAPKTWDSLSNHLKAQGFTEAELLSGGLLTSGQRGNYDRFRGRLLWPIRDLSGDVIGFGARKLYDDDEGPKYLNTPETPIYKKSQVLYGVDLARREISRSHSAVIVEGYTDVMACHLAGVPTAVATCGTAFGVEHIKVLRRLLLDNDQNTGSVIFTFDGDAAGQKAALKAYSEDQRFVAQTFVAIEPTGLDPCDLWQQRGAEAVQQLIANKQPMFEFVIKTALTGFDLNTAEGRIAALSATAPIVAGIRDQALRPEYSRMLSGWLGVTQEQVVAEVKKALKNKPALPSYAPKVVAPTAPNANTQDASSENGSGDGVSEAEPVVRIAPPDLKLLEHRVEREAIKVALQFPVIAADWYSSVETSAYTYPTYAQMHSILEAAFLLIDPVEASSSDWSNLVLEMADDFLRPKFSAALVDPITMRDGQPEERYVTSVIAKLLELDAGRQIADLKSQLQRADGQSDTGLTADLMQQLFALESHRRALFDQSRGIG